MAQNLEHAGTKISRDCPRGLAVQGVTSDLATYRPVHGELAQGILNRILSSGVCE